MSYGRRFVRKRPLNTWVQCNLRIQESQRRELEASARERKISFNEEVRRRLTESFQIESLDSFLYKIGMVAAAQSGKRPARSFIGEAIAEAREAKSKTHAPQQEQEKGGKS
jgi:hypothetical protein